MGAKVVFSLSQLLRAATLSRFPGARKRTARGSSWKTIGALLDSLSKREALRNPLLGCLRIYLTYLPRLRENRTVPRAEG